MSGPRFGRYELVERIDVGGMAEVYRAVLRGAAGFERPVAIKRLHDHIASDPDVVRMFIEEAKLAVHLNHPNIAQTLDLGEVDGTYFIAMEFVDGHSVRTLFSRWSERNKRLPFEAVCHVVIRVADAIHHAHFADDAEGQPLGLIHRDVNPANLLVSFAGEVKVIDFGMAKAQNRASMTDDGVIKGKLAYLSPEQAHGQPIDRRSDLFSLGICAWELLTGRRAFLRTNDRLTVLAIRDTNLPRPSSLAVVPEELDRIVMRALAPNPELRYRTGLELREDLETFLKRSGREFGRRHLRTMMRSTFPERFESQAADEGAIALVQRKTRPPPGPSDGDAPQDESSELSTLDVNAEELERRLEEEFDSGPTRPFSRGADPHDTVPQIRLPEEDP